MPLPRVYFDTNDGSLEGGYWLGLPKSRSDLEMLGPSLKEGAKVIIYMDHELEMEAVLRFEKGGDVWWANAVPGTTTYLDGSR